MYPGLDLRMPANEIKRPAKVDGGSLVSGQENRGHLVEDKVWRHWLAMGIAIGNQHIEQVFWGIRVRRLGAPDFTTIRPAHAEIAGPRAGHDVAPAGAARAADRALQTDESGHARRSIP